MGRIRKRRFYNGDEVEVTWDEEGFLGAWYEAKVVRIVPKTRRYCVVYDHLVAADDDGGDGGGEDPRPLREMADFARVRPRPPRRGGPFVVNQPVDGWHRDGWWTGVVVAAPPDGEESRYTVCFPSPREQMEFPAADLRAHLEWVDDAWVRPDENTPGPEALTFPVGTQVEVVSTMGESLSMWFVATVEKHIWENNLLVQYESRRADAGGEFLREVVHVQHARPCPPLFSDTRKFNILDEVEVFHIDGWCAGVITRIHGASTYNMKSEHWEGEMEFHQSKLRPWLEWMDGSWVQPSKECIMHATYMKPPKPHCKEPVRHSQRSQGRNAACKSHGSLYVSISSDSQDSATTSDSEMETRPTSECQTAISLSCKDPEKIDTLKDDMLLLDSLMKARAANSAVLAEKEFGTPAISKRPKSHISDTLAVQQPRLKKQSKEIIAESSYFDGKNSILVSNKFELKSREQNYHSSVNHEIKGVRHRLKWAQKYSTRPRMNASAQKRKVRTCLKKRRCIDVTELDQHMKEKGGCRGRPSNAKVLNTEASLQGESVGDPQDNKLSADKEGTEPSNGSLRLLELDPVAVGNPSTGELATQELLNVTVSTYTELIAIPDDVQLVEPARAKENESLTAHVEGCETQRVVNEETEIATEVIPCCSPSKFDLPFVKSSPMWGAIAAMGVLHALPQQPHFRPLLNYSSDLREGMAIGLMVSFDKLVTNIMKLRINDHKNIFEERLKMLSLLKDHGFDVQCVWDRVEKLLRIRQQHGLHEDKKTRLQELIVKRQDEGQRLTDEIDTIDRSAKQLEQAMIILGDRRSALVTQRETNECEVAKLQMDERAVTRASLSAEHEFDSMLAAAW